MTISVPVPTRKVASLSWDNHKIAAAKLTGGDGRGGGARGSVDGNSNNGGGDGAGHAEGRYGINSFVYSRNRPFHPQVRIDRRY